MNLRNELLDPEIIPNEWLIERMKDQRNLLLMQSDWTQVVDSALTDSKKAEWATYRQQLRDFPETWSPADTVNFPDQPS
jgi:hypothetical protein